MMKKMENGEKVIGMLCHVTIRLWYWSCKCTPSWASDNEEECTEWQRNIGGNVGRSGASPNIHPPLQGSDVLTLNKKEWSGSWPHKCDEQHQGASGKNPPPVPVHEHYPNFPGIVLNTETLPFDQVMQFLVDHPTIQDFLHHPLFFAIHNFR